MHQLDHQRKERNGFHEVVLALHKTVSQLTAIVRECIAGQKNIFITRLDEEQAGELIKQFQGFSYDSLSRTGVWLAGTPEPRKGKIAIVCGGTSDAAVAQEAYHTAQFYGFEPARFYDVGVAGLHRLLNCLEEIKKNDVVICVAGMEGALPSVLGGLIGLPIIAVPTSVGYGVHLHGLSTLAAMLNSCSEGICVVNIDNGFGAACAAMRILRASSFPK